MSSVSSDAFLRGQIRSFRRQAKLVKIARSIIVKDCRRIGAHVSPILVIELRFAYVCFSLLSDFRVLGKLFERLEVADLQTKRSANSVYTR